MLRSNNLSDVLSVPTSRTNLGLGNSATRNVGTTAGTVAAGDDARFGVGGGTTLAVSDTPPVGAADGSLWWESDSGLLYVRYNDGTSTQWVIAAPQPDINTFVKKSGDTMAGPLNVVTPPTAPAHAASKAYVDTAPGAVVHYDAQSLTIAQQQQAQQNIYAAPFDALAFSGMQINGGMEVSQELGNTGLTLPNATGRNVCDGFAAAYSQAAATAVFTASQYDGAGVVSGFRTAIRMNASTASAMAGANDFATIYTVIEGYRVSRLALGSSSASPFTVSFWVLCPIAGTMTVMATNVGADRSYLVDVHVATTGWEYKTINIPGDVMGAWNNTNIAGLTIYFTFGCGSAQRGITNAWLGGSALKGSPATTNFFATNGNQVMLTGVIVLPGIAAPTAAQSPLIMRPFDQELALCQRYYEKTYPVSDVPGTAYGNFIGGGVFSANVYAVNSYSFLPTWTFRAIKRVAPTCKVYSPWTGNAGGIRSQLSGDIPAFVSSIGTNSVQLGVNNTTLGASDNIYGHGTADARL
jgi:hypothetical protein